MNINWKLRLKNKATLFTLCTTLVCFVYTVLDILGIVPSIQQDTVMSLVTMVVTALAALGIVIDPTTEGLSDSKQAMEYEEPKKYEAGN